MPIKTLVLDFDGTCTDLPAIQARYLDACLAFLVDSGWTDAAEWQAALDAVRNASPQAGWTLGGIPSAPAAADPYILAGEAIGHIGRSRGLSPATYPNPYPVAYPATAAPFRPELRSVLEWVDAHGIAIHFVSNTSTAKITARLDDLLADAPALRAKIHLQGGAEKYVVNEPAWDDARLGPKMRDAFEALPGAGPRILRRPIYLRRDRYLRALSNVWGGDPGSAATTLVCGDVWELDLALPAALGCATHLIERAAPYETYGYERVLAQAAHATVSVDLNGVIARIDATA